MSAQTVLRARDNGGDPRGRYGESVEFNTAGSCKPRLHYMLPPLDRLPEARNLVDRGKYFVLHAPRQSGKTTILKALARDLNDTGDKVALYVSCEAATGEGYEAEAQLLDEIRGAVEVQDYPAQWLPPTPWPDAVPGRRLVAGLRTWARRCPVPIVLFLDEIDTLAGDRLVNVLRQLRSGFGDHPDGFPYSVVLCGMRNVRDYKVASGGNPDNTESASPFNIVKSLTFANFTRDDIATLYAQHTTATGQQFTPDAIDRVFHYTAGQPWLVNAIAGEVTEEMGLTPLETVTVEHVDEAARRLIAARDNHFDSLVNRLKEPRVRGVIDPIMTGDSRPGPADVVFDDDLSYVADLGLVDPTSDPVAIANPLYREVISRLQAQDIIKRVTANPRSFVLDDGRIDLDKLLREFVSFWREQDGLMASGDGYNEAAVQLVLLGFLYRVMNGGGLVLSEPGLGLHHVDILIRKTHTDTNGNPAVQREAIELKVRRDKQGDPVDQGLDQLDTYLAKLGLDTGTLIIFDQRTTAAPLQERGTFTKETTADGRTVQLLRV